MEQTNDVQHVCLLHRDGRCVRGMSHGTYLHLSNVLEGNYCSVKCHPQHNSYKNKHSCAIDTSETIIH